ncbi:MULTISPECIES: hypothetical protein [Gardnerella]|uniref:hypothetical protein n=1 Tax=Gardnerella TaxID=2701 RepID=UPI00020CDD29|nr:hypothetical protein [Gardnerella vaginalis]AEF31625.1 hypothetical protein HMPREF9231_0476 [Gardnerella vaginalis HMP9231]QQO40261.1 hypothetical protein [Gardnerella phage vB_Gva_AB1]
MNKKIMKEVIKDLENLTAHLKTLFDESNVSKEKPSKPVEKPKQNTVSLEQVRAVLAKLSQMGKTAEVKKLIVKHGAQKLSDVPESEYESLLHEAEGIKGD